MARPVRAIIFEQRRKVDRPVMALLNAVAEQTPCDDATGIARRLLHQALLDHIDRYDLHANVPQPGVG